METLIIEPGRVEKNYWRDLFHYRELFLILAWRDVSVRYKQTSAGALWAILQPLMYVVMMTVIFHTLAGMKSDQGPYPILVMAAWLPWQFFSNAVSLASQSVVNNSNLISKIYFPRLIVPTSSVVVSFVDFLVACALMAVMMIWYQYWPTWRLVVIPGLVVLAVAAAIGPSLIITALTVRYRDFRILVPFFVQFGLYACPIAYESSIVKKKLGETWFMVYSMNPMVGVIDGFRWAILGGHENFVSPGMAAHPQAFNLPGFFVSVGLTVAILVFGIRYFRKTERAFADII